MEDTKPEQLLNIRHLIDDAKCYETIRKLRWPQEVHCPRCGSYDVIKHGRDGDCQKYLCKSCDRYFDDLTGTIFSGHHQPLLVWILCLYFMGLNLSNRQIAVELDLHENDVQVMTKRLREGIVEHKPKPQLSGQVECDEVYVVAGHKGNPEAVKKSPQRTT